MSGSGVVTFLAAGLAFALGLAAGSWVLSRVLAARERQLGRERRAVNEIWLRLYRRTGVPRREWMSDFRDREKFGTADVFGAVDAFVSSDSGDDE